MSYIESLLTTDEQIVYRTKKHWIAPLFATVTGSVLTLVGLVGLFWQLFTEESFLDWLFLWGGLVALLVGLALLGRAFVIWWSEDYFVTNQKVMKVSGILNKRAGGAGLEKINDVTMEQNLLGRWLGFGTLRVLTAADESNLEYTTMREPATFRRAMLDQKQQLDQADARYIADAVRGQRGAPAPSPTSKPPTSAPAPGTGAAPQPPAPATRPAGGTAPRSEDIPALIAKLAELHKAGALTDEEFESKKAELLRRL